MWAAALVFAWGYLLSVRRTVPHVSPCLEQGSSVARSVVVVVVDGLRWADAAAALHPLTRPGTATWGPARLLAPPPTATLPAIKSLLTGSLPAFIDVGSGVVVGSARPTAEDTWVSRLRACVRGVRVVAYGDAAWASLVGQGGLDAGSWSVPALDVASSDDSAVWASLLAEVEGWEADTGPSVAIAHVNALDHAQHVGGAGSAAAASALAAVAANLTRLAGALTSPAACAAAASAGSDTLLLVLGDHGCTASGNHGGASAAERETAVAALSVRAACQGGVHTQQQPLLPFTTTISTPDLAPALAFLLGAPPPFSSVGRVPAGLWSLVDASTYPKTLAANAAQVGRYLAAAPWAVGGTAAAHRLAAPLAAARTPAETEAALDAVAAAAAFHHAQFGWVRMVVGLVGLVACAGGRVAGVVREGGGWAPATPLLATAAHAACLFSVGCLQAEGWVVAGLGALLAAWAGWAGARAGRAPAAAAFAATAVLSTFFLPRAARTAAEAMHQAAVTPRHSPHTALPWALAAAQAAWTAAAAQGGVTTAVALHLASALAFHGSGHLPEVAGLLMDLTAGLPHGLAIAVVAADTLAPFVIAGAAAEMAGPRVAAAHAAARATTLAAAAACAALQARHILAPSVFAPRFVFELAFCASAALGGAVVGVVRQRSVKMKKT